MVTCDGAGSYFMQPFSSPKAAPSMARGMRISTPPAKIRHSTSSGTARVNSMDAAIFAAPQATRNARPMTLKSSQTNRTVRRISSMASASFFPEYSRSAGKRCCECVTFRQFEGPSPQGRGAGCIFTGKNSQSCLPARPLFCLPCSRGIRGNHSFRSPAGRQWSRRNARDSPPLHPQPGR